MTAKHADDAQLGIELQPDTWPRLLTKNIQQISSNGLVCVYPSYSITICYPF